MYVFSTKNDADRFYISRKEGWMGPTSIDDWVNAIIQRFEKKKEWLQQSVTTTIST